MRIMSFYLRQLVASSLAKMSATSMIALGVTLLSARAGELANLPWGASGTNNLIQQFGDSSSTSFQYVYVGNGVNPATYQGYFASPAPEIRSASSYTNTGDVTYQSSGYRYFMARITTPGLYTMRVTQGNGDPISAIYVANGGRLPYTGSPVPNLYVFSDDSDGQVANGPWPVYYNKTTSGAECIQFLIYEYGGAGESLTGNYEITGTGPFSESCSPSPGQTLAQLQQTAYATRAAMNYQQNAITSNLTYDTKQFGPYNISLAFLARYVGTGDFNSGGGALIAAYRFNHQTRLGAFIDYGPVPNQFSGVQLRNAQPSYGAFGVYEQNTNLSGWSGRVSAAANYGQMTIQRLGNLDTEPGWGKAGVRTFGAAAELGYGFEITPSVVSLPFVGLRYTNVSRLGYTEMPSQDVSYPISYSPFSQILTTGLAGVRVNSILTDRVLLALGVWAEYDLNSQMGAFKGTSDIPDLASFAIACNTSENRLRAGGSLGVTYKVNALQSLSTQWFVRQQAYASGPAIAGLLQYSMGF